jgi:hypothetical protein
MKAAEIRESLLSVMKEIEGPVEIKLDGGKVVRMWLKRRTEREHIDGVTQSEAVYNKTLSEVSKSSIEDQCRTRLESLEDEVLAKLATDWSSSELISIGVDLLDDLNPEDEETEEKRLETRAERYKQWQEDRFEEFKKKPREELVKLLLKRDIEIHARMRQSAELSDIAVAQCVVDSEGNKVFDSVEAFQSLPHGRLIEEIRGHVQKFIAIENQKTVREVAESPDFQESTG